MKGSKTILLIWGASIFLNQNIKSQTPFYDAITLKKLIVDSSWPQSSKDNVASILANYCRKDEVEKVFFTDNPFIRDFAVTITDKSGLSGIKNITGALSSIGGLDVTKYANAISDLMIERAKQELTVAFFDRFKKFAKKNPEFQVLFPKTTDNLRNLLTYTYPQMLPALRKGFFEDLEKIIYHLDDILELPKYQHILKNFPQVSLAVRSITLIHDLENKTSTIADVIKKFAGFIEWRQNGSIEFKNMGSTVKFAAVFSESLRYKDASRIWVSGEDIKDLISDDILTKIYMGLIYQQVKDIDFYYNKPAPNNTKKLQLILEEQKDNILLFQNKIAEFINLSDKVMDSYTEISKKKVKSEKITNDDIYNYINVSIEVADYAFSIVKVFDENFISDRYLDIVKKSNAIYKDIYSKQYTQAVNDAIDLLTEVHDLTKSNTAVAPIARTGTELDKQPALDALIDFVKKVKPYGLFMANMVEAKDEASIKAALGNAILPVGSSSIKKFSRGNISVQTYLGAFLSTSKKKSSLQGAWSDKFGVAAPIGISWTPGFSSWRKGGSLSLFTALFDLGAIVDYKLKKEPNPTSSDPNATVISKDYKVELGQIFSPGVYAVYGVGANLPLSLGFGAQYGPGLSKIDAGNNTIITNPSWRWNFFLAVDLPFFNLVNKPKHKL